MNTLNPFSGPGSLKAERQQTRRERFKFVVWAIVAANVVLFGGLLIQGCRGEPAAGDTTGGTAPEVAASDTNGTAAARQQAAGDLPVPPTFEPASTNASPATKSKAQTRYVVKSGDTLGRIARTHATTVQAIKAANGLTSDRIVLGQNLKLPASKAAGTSHA